MARHESDREDLMREATAFKRRAEFALPSDSERVFVGFRETGALSVYFGADPVYQFDTDGRLRRAFADGLLYRAQGSTLARLARNRTPETTELNRYDLSRTELDAFLQQATVRLRALADSLAAGEASAIQQIPKNDQEILADVLRTLREILIEGLQPAPPINVRR